MRGLPEPPGRRPIELGLGTQRELSDLTKGHVSLKECVLRQLRPHTALDGFIEEKLQHLLGGWNFHSSLDFHQPDQLCNRRFVNPQRREPSWKTLSQAN